MPIVRAISVLSAVGVITTLVTYAAIQSNGSALAGNTIKTATASLLVSRDSINFGSSVPGYTFSGVVPGGDPQPANGYVVYLENTGSAKLNLNLTVPTPPTVSGDIDLAKVTVLLIPAPINGVQPQTQGIPLSSLIAGTVDLGSGLAAGQTTYYHIQIDMSSDAVSGNSATISNLDLSFGGTATQ